MYRAPHACPVCDSEMQTTRLSCPACGTAIEGRFERSALEKLSREQIHFVEVFLRNEGKITWVAEELKLTYPAARAQLLDIVTTLGVKPAPRASQSSERQEVLRRLAAGEITAEEALLQVNRA